VHISNEFGVSLQHNTLTFVSTYGLGKALTELHKTGKSKCKHGGGRPRTVQKTVVGMTGLSLCAGQR